MRRHAAAAAKPTSAMRSIAIWITTPSMIPERPPRI